MSDETTLLPCPWCGEYPKITEDGGSTGPWFCVWHDCPPVECGKARHYGESLGCISITTAWFHTEVEAIAAWNTRTPEQAIAATLGEADEGCYLMRDGKKFPVELDCGFIGIMPIAITVAGFRYLLEVPNGE